MILCEHQNDLAKFVPANQLELERLEQMLNYLNTHFESIISLQELADQVHLSREVCCRMDIILGFCVRNHSGIDSHDTDIDFSGPIILKKRTAPLTYYTSMRLFFLLFGGNPIFVIEAGNLLDSVKVPAYHLPESHGFCLYVWNIW